MYHHQKQCSMIPSKYNFFFFFSFLFTIILLTYVNMWSQPQLNHHSVITWYTILCMWNSSRNSLKIRKCTLIHDLPKRIVFIILSLSQNHFMCHHHSSYLTNNQQGMVETSQEWCIQWIILCFHSTLLAHFHHSYATEPPFPTLSHRVTIDQCKMNEINQGKTWIFNNNN